MGFLKWSAARRPNLDEALVGILLPEQEILHGNQMARVLVFRERASIHHEKIQPAVVVVIEERRPPADVVQRYRRQAGRVGDVCKIDGVCIS